MQIAVEKGDVLQDFFVEQVFKALAVTRQIVGSQVIQNLLEQWQCLQRCIEMLSRFRKRRFIALHRTDQRAHRALPLTLGHAPSGAQVAFHLALLGGGVVQGQITIHQGLKMWHGFGQEIGLNVLLLRFVAR